MYFKKLFTSRFMAEPTTTTTADLPTLATSPMSIKAEPAWNDLMPFAGLLPAHASLYQQQQQHSPESNANQRQQSAPVIVSSMDDSADDEAFLVKSSESELGPIWNPATSPLPPQPPPPGPYHPMLMMKMMMMNMEHKVGVPLTGPAGTSASLGPMVGPTLFAHLNELNQMAAVAAAASMQQSQPALPETAESNASDNKVEAQTKPKAKRTRKPRTPNGPSRPRTKAISANRRLVPSTVIPNTDADAPKPLGPNPIYRCHLCPYTGNSKLHFNAHMNTHFDHRCPHCDYTSRTEGRLKRHIRDFHSETPPETWSGNRAKDPEDPSPDDGALSGDDACGPNPARNRKYRCKQCNYVAIQKHDYWEHTKQHIKTDKMLNCPKCNFVTEFKHHLVYHLRNHFGSKPFKCAKCNYSCVNKSMLNSHMKSHSNIYQYRCEDCTYATKYCHSLKLHLRKYGHRPATVLNLDGTPNPYPVIDVYGTRRGPRPKKGSALSGSEDQEAEEEMLLTEESEGNRPQNLSSSASSVSSLSNLEPTPSITPPPTTLTATATIKVESSSSVTPRPTAPANANCLKCDYCPFQTECKQDFSNHLLEHVKHEKQALVSNRKAAASKPKLSTTTTSQNTLQHTPPGNATPPPTPLSTTASSVSGGSKFDLPPLEPIQATHAAYARFLPTSYSQAGDYRLGILPQPTFTCGELTPPTPTIEEPEGGSAFNETADTILFKPLDLSGKHSNNSCNGAHQSLSDQDAGASLLPTGAAPNPMALLLMNSLIINAQRNLKDALEAGSGDSEEAVELPQVANGNGVKRRKGIANRIDLSRAMSDEELDDGEGEKMADVPTAESRNYFEMLKHSQMRLTAGESENDEDNDEEQESQGATGAVTLPQHQLPPTPTKSPSKGSIFDFTEDSEPPIIERRSIEPTLSPEPPTTPSPPLAPAILQLIAQLLQMNPTLNPGLIVQQLLPQLLLESNCNLANVTNILSKVFSATSLMQEILMEMATIKK